MKQPPTIVVQLVHIEGPLKGEIQDYPVPEIAIGRHPSCDVRYPKDLAVVSRQHARIVREGNRFKIIDQSSNGTFLNGKAITEAYLKDGDVLMFSEGGPKLSFLTQVVAQTAGVPLQETMPSQEPPSEPPKADIQPVRPEPAVPPFRKPIPEDAYSRSSASQPPIQPVPTTSFSGGTPEQISVQRIQKRLIIQYGPTLRSYNELPVTIGQGSQCDFVLHHPSIFERHAQIFFYQEQYWIKDLSGKNPILINGQPVDREGMLEPDCRLSLSIKGPEFRFLGGGRLAEIEVVPEEMPEQKEGKNMPGRQKGPSSPNGLKDIGGMMKRLFNK